MSDDAGLRAVLDVWMLASCDDLVILQSYMPSLAFPQEGYFASSDLCLRLVGSLYFHFLLISKPLKPSHIAGDHTFLNLWNDGGSFTCTIFDS